MGERCVHLRMRVVCPTLLGHVLLASRLLARAVSSVTSNFLRRRLATYFKRQHRWITSLLVACERDTCLPHSIRLCVSIAVSVCASSIFLSDCKEWHRESHAAFKVPGQIVWKKYQLEQWQQQSFGNWSTSTSNYLYCLVLIFDLLWLVSTSLHDFQSKQVKFDRSCLTGW